jgi:hypothetical protein
MSKRDRRRVTKLGSATAPLAALAIAAFAAFLLLAGRARADVYEGRAESEAPQQPPSFTPEPPIEQQAPFLRVFGARYDSSAGTLTVFIGVFDPEYWAPVIGGEGPLSSNGAFPGEILSARQPRDRLSAFALDDTCERAANSVQAGVTEAEEAEISGSIGSAEAEITERGYRGALTAPVAYANGTYSMTVTNSALTGLDLRCVARPRDDPRDVEIIELADLTPRVTPAHKTCGTLGFKGQSLRVEVPKGHASCSEARRVLRKLYTSDQRGRAHGTHHNPPRDLSETYWLVDGWKCVVGAGGGGCTRGRTNQISGQWQA